MLSRGQRIRSGLVLAAFLLSFSAIVARLFSIQVLHHDYYVARGKRVYETRETIYPKRGSILDRNAKILALSEPTRIICADLRKVQNPQITPNPHLLASRLAELFSLDGETLLRTFALKGRQAVYLKRKPTYEQIESVEKLCRDWRFFYGSLEKEGPAEQTNDFVYQGIFFDNRVRRAYPETSLLCHVIGFVSDDPNPSIGLVRDDNQPVCGVERSANKWLAGETGWRIKNIDNRRRWVLSARTMEKPALNGKNVVLTVDEGIQFICEEEIRRQFDEVPCKTITAIVVRPQTGEILAMANLPSFDPENIFEFDPQKMSNQAIEFSFEPGSTLKAMTGAIALDVGVVKPEEEIHCEGGVWKAPGGPLLHDAHGYGTLTFEMVIIKSSNIGVAKACAPLGPERLYEGLTKFGFGSKTGVFLPGEISGTLRPPHLWTGYSMAEVPMGQEIAVTPLQLAMAFAAIANDGILMKPLIFKEITDETGRTETSFEPQPVRRVLSEKTAGTMKRILQKVVLEGTGKRADVKGYTEAGKTGTAQRALPVKDENGRIVKWVYSDTIFNSTFCGFAPVENPEVVVLVTLQGTVRPKHFGGTVAGPAFARIGERVLRYLQILPDAEAARTEVARTLRP